MTGEGGWSEERLAQRLTETLEQEAERIPVRDGWEVIASRLVSSSGPAPRFGSTGGKRRRRRALGAVGICVAVAAALVLVVVLGWRPSATTPVPAAPPNTSVPRYDPTIPTLVVYRSNVEAIAANQPKGSVLSISPERMRTDARDVGLAALRALFETHPLHPGNVDWGDQKIDPTSVTVSGGLIRVELNAFFSHTFAPAAAHVMAQAWVRTLQDTLGLSDDLLITLQGRPFLLYGQIDTAQPLKRDLNVPVVRSPGFDTPHDGDVAPSSFVLLGHGHHQPEPDCTDRGQRAGHRGDSARRADRRDHGSARTRRPHQGIDARPRALPGDADGHRRQGVHPRDHHHSGQLGHRRPDPAQRTTRQAVRRHRLLEGQRPALRSRRPISRDPVIATGYRVARTESWSNV